KLKNPPKKLFVVHSEADSARHFADFIHEKIGWQTEVPNYKDEIILE
ncbi:MAG: hypothetical protein EHM20_15485, partial [Alphaproteobacteria bacterium]